MKNQLVSKSIYLVVLRACLLSVCSIMAFTSAFSAKYEMTDCVSSDTVTCGRVLLTSEVDKLPSFPGGDAACKQYLTKHIKYPQVAYRQKLEGRVYLQFIVRKDGALDSISLLKGVSEELDNEALRVVRGMPKWRPGVLEDEPVAVRYVFPVRFDLSDYILPDEETMKALYEEGILVEADTMPSFPGGECAGLIHVAKNIKFPMEALKARMQGKVVVQFVVAEDGKLTRISILRSGGKLLDEEAMRVIKSMPDWIPGKHQGKPVAVWSAFPVTFKWGRR